MAAPTSPPPTTMASNDCCCMPAWEAGTAGASTTADQRDGGFFSLANRRRMTPMARPDYRVIAGAAKRLAQPPARPRYGAPGVTWHLLVDAAGQCREPRLTARETCP